MATALEKFPEHARLLGCIIAECSEIEFRFITLLGILLKTDEDILRPMVYAVTSNQARLHAIQAVFNRVVEDKKRIKDITGMLKEAESLLTIRNDYAHAIFVPDRKQDKVWYLVRLNKVGSDRAKRRNLNVADMEEDLVRMQALSRRIAGLTNEVVFEVMPLTHL